MRVEDYTPADLEEVAGEVTLRNEFEKDLQGHAVKLATDPPSTDTELLSQFVEVLRNHSWVQCAAAMTIGSDGRPEILATTGDSCEFWNRAIKDFGGRRTAKWIVSRQTVAREISVGSASSAKVQLLVSHCFGSIRPISLFVTANDSRAIYRSLLQAAAYWVGAFLRLTQHVRAQTEARAEAANAIAHMSASSIEMAQFRLHLVQRELGDSSADSQLNRALEDLKDAQRALQRGQYWSAEEPRFTNDVKLQDEFREVVVSLNEAVGNEIGPIVSTNVIPQCCHNLGDLRVNASRNRLRQSIRDATLGAWMLSGRKTLNVSCQPNHHQGSAAIILLGEGSRIPDEWTAQQLEEWFFDPEIFCLTSEKGIVERALTFDLTRRLLSQMKARLTPAVRNRKFELTIDFQECRLVSSR